MQIVLLLSENLLPVPEDVKVIKNWGGVFLVTTPGVSIPCEGDHVLLEGTEEALKRWLRPFDGVWVGYGSVMLQQFRVKHIKDGE